MIDFFKFLSDSLGVFSVNLYLFVIIHSECKSVFYMMMKVMNAVKFALNISKSFY